MNENSDSEVVDNKQKITVEASDIDGIMAALEMEVVDTAPPNEAPEHPEELHVVLDTLADIYEGVEMATEQDSRGRSRKMVRQYADREDLTSEEVGHLLRVLEGHDLVVQDGNRWRLDQAE